MGILRQNWWGRRTDETESRELRLRRTFVGKEDRVEFCRDCRGKKISRGFGGPTRQVFGGVWGGLWWVVCRTVPLPKVTLDG